MKVLAIESSTHRGQIALADGEKTLAVRSLTKNAEELTLSVDEALKETSIGKSDIGLVAVSSGPGFFTSLKVGAAAAKAFAYALGIPIAPVPSLELLAASADCRQGNICAAIDARSGMFFRAFFRKENGVLSRMSEDEVVSAGELARGAAEMKDDGLTAVLQEGSGARRGDDGAGIEGFAVTSSSAAVCAALGLRLMEEGKTETAFSFSPKYLRKDLYEPAPGGLTPPPS
ncbi:MAG: tRNA (adenosine(37)-N6)-threonylcarbamoyltransferase complex dimerization subunit type 1 TsaB [Thermodesulfobacteriota bacterium]